jgi:hypothetical protein
MNNLNYVAMFKKKWDIVYSTPKFFFNNFMTQGNKKVTQRHKNITLY